MNVSEQHVARPSIFSVFSSLELTGSRRFDVLLLAAPAAMVLAVWGAAPLAVFLFAGLGLIPMAAVLGHATTVVAQRLGPLAAGLLDATLGNASELILGLVALNAGLIAVVKASITGSIISNLLLVLGLAMVVGGQGRKRQRFNRRSATTNTTMLFLAAVGLIVPAVFALAVYGKLRGVRAEMQGLSLWTAAILILVYAVSLVFQLRTDAPAGVAPRHDPQCRAPWRPALLTLGAATAVIAVLSELLVNELGAAQQAFHGTDLFWGGVIFALIGNAAEHGVAVGAARRDQMDLAMAISVGSSLQIALLLAPLLVFASLLLGHPMTLVFTALEVVAVVLSVVMVAMIAADGETNWLEGAQLVAVYAILALAFYFVPA
ncbi:MAG TPA: calcium/proton exchanger [Terriglobales bacterium]